MLYVYPAGSLMSFSIAAFIFALTVPIFAPGATLAVTFTILTLFSLRISAGPELYLKSTTEDNGIFLPILVVMTRFFKSSTLLLLILSICMVISYCFSAFL